MRYYGREGGRSAGRTRFQLTPDSASGDGVEREICTARRCRCRWIAGEPQRRRSAAHLRRLMSPDAVGGDGATRPLARSYSGSGVVAYLRHADSRGVSRPGTLRCAPLRSAYRVTAECRRSATMSADVGGDALQRERRSGPQRGPVFS